MDKKIFITGIGVCREATAHIDTPKPVKTVLKAEELSLAAVSSALKQAGNPGLDTGIVFGIDNSIDRCKAEFFKGLLQEGPIGASPLLFPYTSHNAITAQATIAFGIKGEALTIASGASSFLKAVVYSFELLKRGVMNMVITGGVSENGAMVIVMERLTHDVAQKKEKEGAFFREVAGYNDTFLHGDAIVKSIEESFNIVEGFLKGGNNVVFH